MASPLTIELIGVTHTRANGLSEFTKYITERFKSYGDTVVDQYDKRDKDVTLCFNYPTNSVWAHGRKKVAYSMFECSDIPSSWPSHLKKFDRVIVPCRWNQEIYARNGTQTTIVHYGYRSDVFTLQEREERKTFTFLSYESCTIRKGTKELLKAFKEEFTGEDNVKLILKTVEGSHNHKVEINEKNVEVIDAIYTHQQLLELLQRADCFVFPSMGEGWGTPPLEAMATGIPAIVTNHGGIRDYFGGPGMLAVDTIETPHCYWHLKHEGLDDEVIMVKANIQSLRRQMRNAYEYREMYHDNAQEISRYAQQYPIEKTIRNLRNIMASEVGK